MSYGDKIIDHYNHPRNVGSLDKSSPRVGTGVVGAPECGDVMKLQIECDENDQIVDAKFKTFGCGSAIASSSLATEWIKGKTVDQALEIKNTDIVKELALPPVRSTAACWRRTRSGRRSATTRRSSRRWRSRRPRPVRSELNRVRPSGRGRSYNGRGGRWPARGQIEEAPLLKSRGTKSNGTSR
jgi:Fe-S cluster assembly scaffold IscU